MKNWMKNQNKKRILEKGKINNPNTFSWLDTGTSIKNGGVYGPNPPLNEMVHCASVFLTRIKC
jgi:hypothetical protein